MESYSTMRTGYSVPKCVIAQNALLTTLVVTRPPLLPSLQLSSRPSATSRLGQLVFATSTTSTTSVLVCTLASCMRRPRGLDSSLVWNLLTNQTNQSGGMDQTQIRRVVVGQCGPRWQICPSTASCTIERGEARGKLSTES